jgi:glycerol-3-phosphate dehydrogenase (NAD(P)+)
MIVVIGAGKFGLAIALSFARRGQFVVLLSRRDEEACNNFNTEKNLLNYPGIQKPLTLSMTQDASILQKATHVVMAVPTQKLKLVADKYLDYLTNLPILLLQKGIDVTTTQFPYEIMQPCTAKPVTVLAGPNFADEIIYEKPSITSIVCKVEPLAQEWASMLRSKTIMTEAGTDVVGIQVAGAIKNVVAIAAGVSEALNYGANTLAAIITKGMQETVGLGLAMGARLDTFFEPAGIGDFTLTCQTSKSRNYRFGQSLVLNTGRVEDTVEGAHTVFAVEKLRKKYKIEMPICSSIYNLVRGEASPHVVINAIMSKNTLGGA